MIVKVQLSLATSARVRQALIYNRDRSVLVECAATAAISDRMGEDVRAFFDATVSGQTVVLGNKLTEQGW